MLALLAGAAAADPPRTTALGFDHIVHDRNLIVKGGEALPCERCHVVKQGKLVGRPGHAGCFGKCHGAAPTKAAPGDRVKICTSCHSEAALQKPKPTVAYPPYTIDRDFNIAFGHKQHAQAACTQCHQTKAQPHTRCIGCHDGSKAPAMDRCASCHPQAVGKPQPPTLAAVHDTVTATFSHARHAARGGAGKDCTTCHAGVRATNDSELPRPTVKDCATCHDGKSAFATTSACTKCHERPPPADEKFEVFRTDTRFLHAGVHADVVKARPCNACHPLDPRGNVLVTGHASCTNAQCHADEFGARKPALCGACHNATEPWRRLVADRPPPDTTEFGATLDHGKHKQPCTSCHVLRTASQQLRMPRGHAACQGSACHAARTGPVPHFESCDGCHRAGLAKERDILRANAPWSVRLRFDHKTHAVACDACHKELAGAGVLALPTPTKSTCLPCHDTGKTAFKLTGTTCERCHGGPRS